MTWLDRLLVRFGFAPEYSEDDRINASTEDAARVHEKAVSNLHDETQKRMQSNDALRQSIQAAKNRTAVFAEFDRLLHRERRRYVRRSD